MRYMLSYTKPKLVGSARFKKHISDSDIPIAKVSSLIDKHSVGVSYKSSSELSQSNLKEMIEYKFINGLPEQVDTFPTDMPYDDGAYNGTLNKVSVEFKRNQRVDSRFSKEVKKIYTVAGDVNNIPSYIDYTDEEEYKGRLGIKSIAFHSNESSLPKPITVTSVNTLYFLTVNGTGATGSGDVFYNETLSVIVSSFDKIKSKETWVNPPSNGIFSPSIILKGINYLFTGTKRSKVIDTWVKHYGTCRYWGGGANHSNNYYGDPDYRFSVDGWTAKGYMNGAVSPPHARYGHKKNQMIKRSYGKYPVDCGGYWGKAQGEMSGILWTYDIEEAKKYGGHPSVEKGGSVWASAFKNKPFPPVGYERDHLGSDFEPKHSGNNGTLNHRGKLVTKSGAQKTSLAGFYNYGGWYCKWFRDLVIFYKGKTTKTVHEGLYETKYIDGSLSKITSSTVTIKGFRKETVLKETVADKKTTSIKYEVTYSGDLYKIIYSYSSIATYKGNVYKEYFLSDKVIPSVNEVCFVDDNGVLSTIDGSLNMGKRYVELTDVEKDGVPLFYRYKCKAPVSFDLKGDRAIAHNIAFISGDTSGYLFNFEVQKENSDKYIYVYSNKETDEFDKLYVEYVSRGTLKRELLSTALSYNQGIDFSMSYANLEYRVSTNNSAAITDTRSKVSVSYKIETSLGKASKLYECKVINRAYATSNEKEDFYLKMCPVTTIDAKKILATDLAVTEDSLDNEKFFIKVISSTGVVDAFVDDDGLSPVYFETLEYTGLENEDPITEYTSVSLGGTIRKAYHVRTSSATFDIEATREDLFTPVFAKIDASSFTIEGRNEGLPVRARYDLESNQYSSLGMPYVARKVMLRATDGVIKINEPFLKVLDYISLDAELEIESIGKGYIKLTRAINKDVSIEYLAIADYLLYRGFSSGGVNYLLDLNISSGHKYTSQMSLKLEDSKHLFGKRIYIFLRPKSVVLDNGETLIDNTNKSSVYHKVEDIRASGPFDSLIGVLYVTDSSHVLLEETSSLIGGGLKKEYIEKNKDNLSGFFDVAKYTEKAIKNHSTIVSTIDKDIIDEQVYGNLIKKHLALGVLNVIK